MFVLPKSTEYGKRIPKQKFYENLSVNTDLKKIFVEQISSIIWKNKIAPSTMNIEKGETVTEIEVFEIRLNQRELDFAVLRQMDKEIPYHILFLLEYRDKFQAWIGFKEKNLTNKNTFKVNNYYHTEWLLFDELPLRPDGLNMDAVYDNFVKQIAGKHLLGEPSDNLKDTIEREEKRRKLLKQITKLENKIKNEKQFNIQIKLNDELKKHRKSLEEL